VKKDAEKINIAERRNIAKKYSEDEQNNEEKKHK